MRYLWNRDTRQARIYLLRRRWDTFRFGDEIAEPFLAALATVYGIVLVLPGDTTSHATAWRVLRSIFGGDNGLSAVFITVAAVLWLGAFRLLPMRVHRAVLLLNLSLWVGMAVGFAFGYPWSLGPYLCILYAQLTWLAYMRSLRELP